MRSVQQTLWPEEIGLLKHIGKKRQDDNDRQKKKDAYRFKGDGAKAHYKGACAEWVTAIVMHQTDTWIAWYDSDRGQDYTKAEGDVGLIGVRGTKYGSGCLLLHPGQKPDGTEKDPDGAPFVLVTYEDWPTLRLEGWCFGHEGKQQRFWRRGDRPAFFVGQQHLRPIEALYEQRDLLI